MLLRDMLRIVLLGVAMPPHASASTTVALRLRGGALSKAVEQSLVLDDVAAISALGVSALKHGLHVACKHGATACADLLVARGFPVDEARADGVTPMMLAAQNGHEGCMRTLLRAKAVAHSLLIPAQTDRCIVHTNLSHRIRVRRRLTRTISHCVHIQGQTVARTCCIPVASTLCRRLLCGCLFGAIRLGSVGLTCCQVLRRPC